MNTQDVHSAFVGVIWMLIFITIFLFILFTFMNMSIQDTGGQYNYHINELNRPAMD